MASRTALLAGAAAAVVVLAGGGGTWYYLTHSRDPMVLAREMTAKGDLRGAGLELRNAVRDQPNNGEAHFRLAQIQLLGNDPIAAEREARLAVKTGYDAAAANQVVADAMLRQGRFQPLLDEFKPSGLPPAQAASLDVTRTLAQLALGDGTAAAASIKEAEQLAPDNATVALTAARVAASKRDFDAAQQDVEHALKINPKMVDALLLKGQIAFAKGDRSTAAAAFERAVQLAPASAAARLERANIAMLANDDAKARADVEAVIKADPRNASARYLMAVLLIRAKDYKGAGTALDRISGQLDSFPRGLYFLALNKAALGDTAQAIDAIEKYVARYPQDPEGLKLLGRIELGAKQPDAVINALAPAASANKADAETLDLLGRAYAAKGSILQAVQTLQRASKLAPDNTEILAHLAATRLTLGDAPGAASAIEHSLEVKPDQPDAQRALVVAALQAGHIDEAEAALGKLREQDGDTEVVNNLAGTIRLAALDLPGAEQQFRDNVQKFPGSVQAKLNLSRTLAIENKRDEAMTVLEEALKQEPSNIAALTALTNLALQQNQAGRAVAAAEAAHQAAPSNDGVTAGLAQLYVRAGDPKKALALLDQAGGDSPTQPILAARAQAQFAAGDAEAARNTWRQLLTVEPRDIGARRLLVSALVQAKKFDEARDVLQQGLALQPGNPALLGTSVALAEQEGGLPAALSRADELRKDANQLPAASVLKGDLLMGAGRFADASAAFQAEYAQSPSLALALRAANALQAAGKSGLAMQQLQDWLKSHPKDPDATRLLASFELAAGHYADAEQKFTALLAQRPNDPVVLNNLAWSLQQQGKPDALPYARRAFLADPTPAVADTLGWVLATHGAASDAVPLLRQAAGARPKDPSVKYHLALALNETGNKQEAIDLLHAALGATEGFNDKPKAQALLTQLTGKK